MDSARDITDFQKIPPKHIRRKPTTTSQYSQTNRYPPIFRGSYASNTFKITSGFHQLASLFFILSAILYIAAVSCLDSDKQDLGQIWASKLGQDVHQGTSEVTCLRSIRKEFDPNNASQKRSMPSIVSIQGAEMHSLIVKTIATAMGWHQSAVEEISRAAENFAGNHTFNKSLCFEYTDVHKLSNLDELEAPSDQNLDSANDNPDQVIEDGNSTSLVGGEPVEPLPTPSSLLIQDEQQHLASQAVKCDRTKEWQTPQRYRKLTKHPNFGDVLINTDESAVHVPVHIYPAESEVMNSIAWSEQLTRVFRENFIKNPRLTNQYIGLQSGFMRLYPAQKWQVARTDPDLYDARMRPWYLAGATSRKDVVILVDSSGSMTGTRRDIARGVVSEILDTLTDNDHFLVLRFSDSIQQVGVPACRGMRVERPPLTVSSGVPLKNTHYYQAPTLLQLASSDSAAPSDDSTTSTSGGIDSANKSSSFIQDLDSLYLLPATGRNVRHLKTNFTIPTAGIANFSNALITAFEVLRKYQNTDKLGSQCNQAIMLITDGSPSDFEEIFRFYNHPNGPVRVFTYLIGREAGDVSNTKMMACRNRGYYAHVINLAEVRETVQQYLPVMARPLVLNGTHPMAWTAAYGELTYQILTDWIWESKRREKARAIWQARLQATSSSTGESNIDTAESNGGGVASGLQVHLSSSGGGGDATSSISDSQPAGSYGESYEGAVFEEEVERMDLFGYRANGDCFWQQRRNDLLTTVVQPVYDRKNETVVTERFLLKNVWTSQDTVMRNARLLGVAAADMKINDLIDLAPSYKLGANSYTVILTNNGFVMHHPDLRSILEPQSLAGEEADLSPSQLRILKPFFASLDLTQVEHVADPRDDAKLLEIRQAALTGTIGMGRDLRTKRTLDCQKRVQSRTQKLYYMPIGQFPFSSILSMPKYGSHRVEAQVQLRQTSVADNSGGDGTSYGEALTNYFTASSYDSWSVHPDYNYCEGPANNTVATLLDMFQRIDKGRSSDITWRSTESSNPLSGKIYPDKIVCDKELVQSLVYDAIATFDFSEACKPNFSGESNLIATLGVRFSFVATRSGLTRVRLFDTNDDEIRKEALAFAKHHNRAIDETFYSRTVDFNMLMNDTATLVQVNFNTHVKIREHLERYAEAQYYQKQQVAHDYSGSSASGASEQDSSTLRLREPKDMDLFEKLGALKNSSIHVIASQSVLVGLEGPNQQRAVSAVTGAFYNYAHFVERFFNSTSPSQLSQDSSSDINNDIRCQQSQQRPTCGCSNDTLDCLLIDNNGYILVSEQLDYIGRHLGEYDATLLELLVAESLFERVHIIDYQSVCLKREDKQPVTSSSYSLSRLPISRAAGALLANALSTLGAVGSLLLTLAGTGAHEGHAAPLQPIGVGGKQSPAAKYMNLQANKTYLRPCERILTLYEMSQKSPLRSRYPIKTRCEACDAYLTYEQVPQTNLVLLLVDSGQSEDCLRPDCVVPNWPTTAANGTGDGTKHQPIYEEPAQLGEEQVCALLERESQLYRHKLGACHSRHPDEEQIKLCGSGHRPDVAGKLVASLAATSLLCMALLAFRPLHQGQ